MINNKLLLLDSIKSNIKTKNKNVITIYNDYFVYNGQVIKTDLYKISSVIKYCHYISQPLFIKNKPYIVLAEMYGDKRVGLLVNLFEFKKTLYDKLNEKKFNINIIEMNSYKIVIADDIKLIGRSLFDVDKNIESKVSKFTSLLHEYNGFFIGNINKHKYLFVYRSLSDLPWKLILTIPYEVVPHDFSIIAKLVIILLVISQLLYSLYNLYNIHGYILKLNEYMLFGRNTISNSGVLQLLYESVKKLKHHDNILLNKNKQMISRIDRITISLKFNIDQLKAIIILLDKYYTVASTRENLIKQLGDISSKLSKLYNLLKQITRKEQP